MQIEFCKNSCHNYKYYFNTCDILENSSHMLECDVSGISENKRKVEVSSAKTFSTEGGCGNIVAVKVCTFLVFYYFIEHQTRVVFKYYIAR